MNPQDSLTLANDLGSGRNAPRVVCAANESRFNATHLSQPLTDYAIGWKPAEDIATMLNFLAPEVPVARRFEFKRGTNSHYFFSEDDDVRAIGASFKRVEYEGEVVNSKTLNKGLTIRVDHDDEADMNFQERYVNLLLNRLWRNELRRAAALLATAAGSPASKNWGPAGTTDPDADLMAVLIASGDDAGISANRVLFGMNAWQVRYNKYKLSTAPAAGASASMTPEQLSNLLMVDGVRVSKERYQSTVTAKSKVITGDSVFAFFGVDSAMKDDPSTLKRFVTPTGQGKYAVYVEQHPKFTDISVEHYSELVATSTIGAKALTITNT